MSTPEDANERLQKLLPLRPNGEVGGDIQATTKAVDCRSLKSSPPNDFTRSIQACGFCSRAGHAAVCGHSASDPCRPPPSRPVSYGVSQSVLKAKERHCPHASLHKPRASRHPCPKASLEACLALVAHSSRATFRHFVERIGSVKHRKLRGRKTRSRRSAFSDSLVKKIVCQQCKHCRNRDKMLCCGCWAAGSTDEKAFSTMVYPVHVAPG